MHPQHAQRQRMRFRQHPQRHQGLGGRQVGFFRQLANVLRRVDHPTAQIEHRTLRGVNHRRRFTHAGAIEHRSRRTGAGFRQGIELNGRGLNILRNIYPHRPWSPGLRDAKRVAHHLRQFSDVAYQIVMFRDGDRDTVGVNFLEGIGADH